MILIITFILIGFTLSLIVAELSTHAVRHYWEHGHWPWEESHPPEKPIGFPSSIEREIL